LRIRFVFSYTETIVNQLQTIRGLQIENQSLNNIEA